MESKACKNGGSCDHCENKETAQEDVPRRKALGMMVGVINGGVALAILAPTAGFVASPLRRKEEPEVWTPILGEAELHEGEVRHITYPLEVEDGYMTSKRNYSVFLSRTGAQVAAYDPSCPHLGCHVEYKERKKRFVCPCHGGVFDQEGNRVSGPPPSGLKKIAVKVEDGRIWVRKG